jgi:hypothetical protein
MIKEELDNNSIDYIERDIDDYEEEYDEFSKKVGSDYLPAMMLFSVNEGGDIYDTALLAPEKHYHDIYEGIELIKHYLLI